MSRKLLINIHLYLAAFFAPMVILMAISGGLYLVGIKGEQRVESSVLLPGSLNPDSAQLEEDVRALLDQAGLSRDFEQVKVRGREVSTRPSNRLNYRLTPSEGGVQIDVVKPSLQASLIELHKGHGPQWFRLGQQIFSLALVLIMLSGLWLGLAAKGLRTRTLQLSVGGLAVFLLLALFA
ncbi:PepSY-associated TM helix domain-containing protein [Spongiibacter tropicus]|uniref:PepSY-associated TM helix domain-containing protein n=1 Tax=Spongiibacter tropicus TaxID=454602 RepID=UPI0035BE18B3